MAGRKATNDTVRRTWDDETFTQRAKQRAALEEEGVPRRKVPFVPAAERVELAPRAPGERFDADTIAGSSVVIPDGALKSEAGGFYCRNCDVLSHDSSAHQNHMNSRAHQAVMGISMRVKRSSAEDVRRAFAAALARRKAREAAFGKPPLTLDELLRRRKKEYAARKSAKVAEKSRGEEAEEKTCGSVGTVPTAAPDASEKISSEVATNKQHPQHAENSEVDAALMEEMRRAGLPTSF